MELSWIFYICEVCLGCVLFWYYFSIHEHTHEAGSCWICGRCVISWSRQWHPLQYGRRSLVGCSPWGREESDTTEPLPFHFSLACIGEGNGSPLQCSFLESPRDGGARRAAVCGVARSRARLQRLSSSSSGVISAMSVHCQLFKHYWIHCGLARSIWEPDFSCGHMPSSVLYFLTEGNYIEIIFLLEFF